MLSRKRRWLARAKTIDDFRTMAARTTPRSVFDYVDGGAESEISVERSRASFQKLTFHPRILRGVSEVDTRALILGKQGRLPLVLGPSGFTRMLHHEGERGVAVAAATAGIPYALSTMGTTSLEDVRSAAPHGEHWFQLYVWRDRGLSAELIRRAQAAGYSALVLTVDVPVPGARLRDIRNGLTIPPALRLRTLADMSRHLSWWFNLLTTEPLSFASLSQSPTALNELITTMFDPSVTFDDLDWLRSQWQGPLIVKGIQRADDAVRAVQAGADALVLSNHGGRQLDRAVTPLELLPAALDAVQDRAEIYLDGGVRSGADVAAAVALGARACMIGRPYLYGLMAGGAEGVRRTVDILSSELTRTMQLLGARALTELTPDLVTSASSVELDAQPRRFRRSGGR